MGGAGAGQPTCKIEPYFNNFQENGVSGQEKHLPKQTISTFIYIIINVMLCTVWSPLHGIGRAIARWNRLVIKKIRVRAFFVCARHAPAVRENMIFTK